MGVTWEFTERFTDAELIAIYKLLSDLNGPTFFDWVSENKFTEDEGAWILGKGKLLWLEEQRKKEANEN